MPQRYITSPSRGCWTIAVLLMLLTVTPLVANAASPNVSIGTGSGDGYSEQILGGGHGEGDVWGGEQATPVKPTGDFVPAESIDTQTSFGQAFWLVRLASLFAWFRSSPWFSNLD